MNHKTPPLGTFSTAQDSRGLSRIYSMEPEPFARGADGSLSREERVRPLGLLSGLQGSRSALREDVRDKQAR